MVKKLSTSSAFEELEKIAQQLENGEMDLEKAIKLYKQGLKLAGFLKMRLTKIGNEIREIKEEPGGVETNKDKKFWIS